MPHPDKNIDLCAISLGSSLKGIKDKGEIPYIITMTKNNIPSSAQWRFFSPIEKVNMIGCPNGLFDDFNNSPLARQGITATPLYNSYKSKPNFLVDMACYPGSSGSPILINDQGIFTDRKGDNINIGSRMLLVGILYAGPMIENNGSISFKKNKSFSVQTTMHLGLAIRSDKLLAFDEHYQADYQRRFT